MAKHVPATKIKLEELVEKVEYLGDIDVSAIDDMSFLFHKSKRKTFYGIETWDTSRVRNMNFMFSEARFFNHHIFAWDVSNVETMIGMFERAVRFNQPLGAWNVSNVKNMEQMFYKAERFNQPLDAWDLKSIKSISAMFCHAKSFSQNLDSWKIGKRVVDSLAFKGCKISPKWYKND